MVDVDNETHYDHVVNKTPRYKNGRSPYITKKKNPVEWEARRKGKMQTNSKEENSTVKGGNEKSEIEKPVVQVVNSEQTESGNEFKDMVDRFSKDRQTGDDSTDTIDPGDSAEEIDPRSLDGEPVKDNFITGEMLLILMDVVIPMIGSIGIKVLSKGKKKAKISNLKLTEDEKECLLPLCDAISKDLLGNMSPLSAFFIVASAIYIPKFMAEFNS